MVLPRKTVVSNADKILTQTPVYQRDTTKDYKNVVSDINEVLRKKSRDKIFKRVITIGSTPNIVTSFFYTKVSEGFQKYPFILN